MRSGEQTGKHLLLAVIATVFTAALCTVAALRGWEIWFLPLLGAACVAVWALHITRFGSSRLYETLCAGLLLLEFFFFCVHPESLFDIPAMAGILVFSLFSLNQKWTLFATLVLYLLALLYHALVLGTISPAMGGENALRLALGAAVVFGGLSLARYWVNQRKAQLAWYESVFEELETVGKQNAGFLSNVSHELRTPINMVIGISGVALDQELDQQVRGHLLSIQNAGKRLSSQISNMMDYTEIVSGTMTATREEYMITSVLNDLITSTALSTSRSQLEMVFDMDPRVPAVLLGDGEKISHVLKILVENAVKFTEAGGVNVRISCRQEEYGANLVIHVDDTGIGMTEGQMERMYQEFYQADAGSSRFAGGLGLGLPIARGLLDAMGGFLHFDKKTQQGLHAHLVIPQGVADPSPCIAVVDPQALRVGCYFKPEKFSCDEVRGYYNGLLQNLTEGLGIEGYEAHSFEGLLKLLGTHALTHVFLAQPGYEENPAYYEELSTTVRVVVIGEREFSLPPGRRLSVIHKPFSALSVANLLNGETGERGFAEDQAAGRKPFVCPGVRALAVDDEEMNLVVAKGVLGSYGMEVDGCLSGPEALDMCREGGYDIVFLDHMMPGMDGVEVLRRLRELPGGTYGDLPVIALTANTVSGAREMFRSEGFTEFVPKPIERAVLERVLRKVLPKSRIVYSERPIRPAREQPPAPAPEEAPDPLEVLRGLGVNVEMGMEFCAGDRDFYWEMLEMFRDLGEQKDEELEELFAQEDWGEYAVKAHALKSTALTIGAESLSSMAKELELAGKGRDGDFIRGRHPALLQAHRALWEGLGNILGEGTEELD